MRTPSKSSIDDLSKSALHGNRRSISKLMSLVENDSKARVRILSKIYWRMNRAKIIGITGPPGCGKSTLIGQLAKRYRDLGSSVGVVAVDPSSQITGGALLGDRIRMGALASDPKILIRSMATRGHFGGIAQTTEDIVHVLDACGMEYVIVETAGAGQSDVDVKNFVQTTIVVTAPGLGDEIQALKAGIMEIGDIFVVNKADIAAADKTAQEILSMVMMSERGSRWSPRVLKTVAVDGGGISGLAEAIDQHAQFLKEHRQDMQLSARTRRDVLVAARRYFEDVLLPQLATPKKLDSLVKRVQDGDIDPFSAAKSLLRSRPPRKQNVKP